MKAREKAAQQHRQSFTSVVSTFNNTMQRNSIIVLLNSFAKNEYVSLYREQFKERKRELYELSQVVLAVPVTQVSAARACSGLKYVLSPLRTSMSQQLGEYTTDT